MNPLSDNELDQLVADYGSDFTPDVEAGLRRLHARMGRTPGRQAVVRRIDRRRWMTGIAALLLVAVGYFGLFYHPETVYANNGDAPRQFVLPDGSLATLQSGSEIAFTDGFNVEDRRLRLDGQAFFKIHSDDRRPFLVRNGETQLRVTGTAFNLRVTDDELEVEVSEGSVQLVRKGETLAVRANECGVAKAGKPCALQEAPHLNRHAWRTGKLYFRDAELLVVLEALRSNFGFTVAAPTDCDFSISGTFSTENPEEILRTVARLGGGSAESIDGQDNGFRLVGVCK